MIGIDPEAGGVTDCRFVPFATVTTTLLPHQRGMKAFTLQVPELTR